LLTHCFESGEKNGSLGYSYFATQKAEIFLEKRFSLYKRLQKVTLPLAFSLATRRSVNACREIEL
jgi:hypothetical protein